MPGFVSLAFISRPKDILKSKYNTPGPMLSMDLLV